ncbi:MAG: glutamate-5-semialdehyde dehydrogenase, partial [Bacteroidaceae bacterium]|nr:glutamate-5-semialdehyde dehydrogenase [Bacteroidaceae bacterium]
MLTELFQKSKEASLELALVEPQRINQVLLAVADAMEANSKIILEANAQDLHRMDSQNPLYDRLRLTFDRIKNIAEDMRNVSRLPSPLGRVLKHHVLPNGLDLTRISVPFGVIGVVYEARPNVTFDVFSLCLKAGSSCILKGGKDADSTNQAEVSLIRKVLQEEGINPNVVTLLPATHEATTELLHAASYVDLIIPRGSKRLIDFVRQEATIPTIETGAGVCHAYFDKDAELEKGARIINNAKTRRVSVCNALDCLLVHESRLADLPQLCASLQESRVLIYADEPALTALKGQYPDELLRVATEESYGTEFLSYTMAIKTVSSLDEVL